MKKTECGHPYLPHTEEDISEMLGEIGASDCSELFESIPDAYRLEPGVLEDIPQLSEQELSEHLVSLGAENKHFGSKSFVGGGAYAHYIPASVSAVLSRGEFFTAYTPYQPEISQGTLQAVFEYQSLLCQLTGMDIANASMYDGATATAEAALMLLRASRLKSKKILVCGGVNQSYRNVLESTLRYTGSEVETLGLEEGMITDIAEYTAKLDAEHIAGIVIQTPNQFGLLEPMEQLCSLAKEKEIPVIYTFTEALSLSVLKKPSEYGVDIVAGEGQSFGNSVSFGGPQLGLFAARKKYQRQMPGRIVGQTTDKDGKRGFVLTLATREQHIRRERATSNICSNQALCALGASVYLSLLGKEGLRELGLINAKLASYACEQLSAVKGVTCPPEDALFFNEFVLQLNCNAEELVKEGVKQGMACGIPLSRLCRNSSYENALLLTFTEINSKESIDALVSFVRQAT